MQDELERVSEWARDRIRAGQEPPWTYYKLMQLVDAIESLRDPDATQRMENSLQSPERSQDDVRPQQAAVVSLDIFRRPPGPQPQR